jgi:hypothetical protein
MQLDNYAQPFRYLLNYYTTSTSSLSPAPRLVPRSLFSLSRTEGLLHQPDNMRNMLTSFTSLAESKSALVLSLVRQGLTYKVPATFSGYSNLCRNTLSNMLRVEWYGSDVADLT